MAYTTLPPVKVSTASSSPLPLPASTPLGQRFKFYLAGQICDGLAYNNRLYQLQRTIDPYRQLNWAEQEGALILQADSGYYEVWTELRSAD